MFRHIDSSALDSFLAYEQSGLKDCLESVGRVVKAGPVVEAGSGYVTEVEKVHPIVYPYEWGFSQYKAAALLTLDIAERALERGLILKDASAYNVQFRENQPVFIDLLSFEPYKEGQPWQAYGQFCRHFLAPLALASKVDIRLLTLSRQHIDGIPLDLAAALLPHSSKVNGGLLTHIHLHAKATHKVTAPQRNSIPKLTLLALIDSLRRTVQHLSWKPQGIWANYYDETNYDNEAAESKRRIVDTQLSELTGCATCLDLGANDGSYSKIARERGLGCTLCDGDYGALESAFASGIGVAVFTDLANPSPSQGWSGVERLSFFQRLKCDVVLALALLHHLRIGNNTPLRMIAEMLAELGPNLIIEFVPKDDSQVQRMLSSRDDIFADYTEAGFQEAFAQSFEFVRSDRISRSTRSVHLLKRR